MTAKRVFCALIGTILTVSSITPVFAGSSGMVISTGSTVSAVRSSVVYSSPILVNSAGDPVDEKDVAISKDHAKEIALQFLDKTFQLQIDEKLYQSRIELRKNAGLTSTYVWEFSWNKYDGNESSNINVTVDAQKGKVLRLNKYEYNSNGNQAILATITEEQAKETADAFINKVFPKEAQELKAIDNQYRYNGNSPDYSFDYRREINGISFDSNMVSVGVDGRTGTVRSFNFNWDDDLSLPSTENIISKEKADELLRSALKMKLQYITVRDNYQYAPAYSSKVPVAKLVYMPEYTTGGLLDAQTGTLTDITASEAQNSQTKDLSPEEKEQILKSITPAEKSNSEIDNKKADAIANKLIKEFLGDEYGIENLQYEATGQSSYAQAKPVWEAYFRKNGQVYGPGESGNLVIDASTGRLMSLSKHFFMGEDEEAFEPVITWEQAYDKAIQAIAKYFPEKLKDIRTEQTYTKHRMFLDDKEMPERVFYFNFPRLVNGLEYMDNIINVEVDLKTGNITTLQSNWNDKVDFPLAEKAITQEDALKIYFDHNTPALAYVSLPKNPDDLTGQKEIKLVYRLQNSAAYYSPGYIDALPGSLLNYDGTELNGPDNGFKDKIKGYWAENQLSILAYQNIIDTKTFDMEKEVTLADFVKMVVNARGFYYNANQTDTLKFTNISKDSDIYPYLQMAVQYGLLENAPEAFDANQPVTREEMAELLIKFLGYETLAQSKDIFNLSFEDAAEISPDKYGYVAIGKGLDIFAGSDGKFRPKDNTTMVEAAITIYNALGKIKNMH